jgi:hypothetical protein
MKKIEITPEWILTELPHMHVADGNGKMSFYTDSVTDVRWITLALDTLGIEFEDYDEGDDQVIFFWFEVLIEDFKENCPELYIEWVKDNEDAKIDRSVESAFEQFLFEIGKNGKQSTIHLYSTLKILLEDFCKDKGQNFSWAMLQAHYESELKEYLIGRYLSIPDIRRYIKAKKMFLRWCANSTDFNKYVGKI